jgi:hypothetical protein
MQRDQSDLRAHRTAPQDVPALSLEVDRLLDEFTRHPVSAEFRFDPGTPLLVSIEFVVERGPSVTWRVGRELLHRGLTSMSGTCDVRMWPTPLDDRSTAWLSIESPEMSALFELPIPALAAWLESTYRITSADAEMDGLDWDGFLAEVLDDPETRAG